MGRIRQLAYESRQLLMDAELDALDPAAAYRHFVDPTYQPM